MSLKDEIGGPDDVSAEDPAAVSVVTRTRLTLGVVRLSSRRALHGKERSDKDFAKHGVEVGILATGALGLRRQSGVHVGCTGVEG
jgi:hypothetical protein